MEEREVKKAFVEPTLTEEASLEDVTLMSGGVSFGHSPHIKKPKKGHGPGGHGPSREGHGHSNRSS